MIETKPIIIPNNKLVEVFQRIADQIEADDETKCWNWVGDKSDRGYARIKLFGKMFRVQRVTYTLCIGQIPEGLVTDHLCRNHSCVNPYHLEAVTQKVNVERGDWEPLAGKFWAAKTHCPSGHPYDEENTYHTRQGKRQCRECKRIRQRKKSPA